jgi:menaquinone-specific isochorismate synthase
MKDTASKPVKTRRTRFSLSQVSADLERQLKDYFSRGRSGCKILRLELGLEPLSILGWLANQALDGKIYWCDRDRRFEAGGLGSIHTLEGGPDDDLRPAAEHISENVKCNERLRYYGGTRFNHSLFADDDWRPYNYYRFILPEFEIVRRDASFSFAWNLFDPKGLESDLPGLIRRLAGLDFGMPAQFGEELPSVQSRDDFPDAEGWNHNVESILSYLKANGLKKVVLARKTKLKLAEPLAPEQILFRLKNENPNSFLFLFSNQNRQGFMGSTPERLYRRDGRRLFTEAVAGTRPRGSSAQEDQRLKEDLLNCDKDIREHDYVTRYVDKVLRKYCSDLKKDRQAGILENARVQHLIVRFEALLQDGVGDSHLLKTLHPTPAVGGVPTGSALHKIAELEQFDRGWYAGPVGWINRDGAEFAVAIRSAMQTDNLLQLYAGAGIVDGSQPAAEWQELENKIAGYLRLFTR